MKSKKTVLITGGNSGIGYATARHFKSNNFQVVISGRNKLALEKAAKQLECAYAVADLDDLQSLKKLTELFPEGLDALINNGGTATFIPIELNTPEIFDHFMQTNVRAPLFLSQYFLPALQKRSGVIINVSSVIVESGKINGSLYAASKGAIDAMTRSLALEFASRCVRVNAVSPGPISTPIFDKTGLPEELVTAALQAQISVTPLKRMGTPEEVAEVIFSQSQSTYVTGAIWTVDGGIDAQ